ncbi:Glutathione S-transferase [Orchesella cincta]|uniref:Glutathione S-transferase n=1 Tax=Orchesella cincta TaxID=48709 RepID=A0A1D2MBX2_ORCCI|nr:Glutathione S-transferase [Orchesella cincta]
MSEDESEPPPYRLVYFDIRGLAEPVRWMFCLAGLPFVDERVPLVEWNEAKKRYQDHVGQLPILYFDDQELSQVHTVMRFVARRLGFNGLTDMEAARADEATDLVYDLRAVTYRECFTTKTPDIVRHTVFRDFKNEPSQKKKEPMRKDLLDIHLPKYLSKFEELLDSSGGRYIAGTTLTYADLAVANFLDVATEMIGPDILDDFPGLQELKENVFSLPPIQQWCATRTLAQGYSSGG